MPPEQLDALTQSGWRLTRDGSTATAHLVWEDPDDPESAWEILVLHTAGHGARLTVNVDGSGLTERSADEAARFEVAMAQAMKLVRDWRGELPD